MPPRKRSLWPTAKAVSPEQAKPSFDDLVRELKSRKEAEERAAWRASGLEPIVRQSAAAAPSAEVTGWGLISPNLYRKLGGDVQHPMLPENANPYWAAFEAATLLPFGKPVRAGVAGVKRLTKLGRGAKAAEEVVEKAPLPEGAEKIIEALPAAKRLSRQQKALQRVERGKRVAKAAEAMKAGGREGRIAALHELKGVMPKIQLGALKEMDQETVEELLTYVGKHPDLQFFERIRTQGAIVKLVDEGVLPIPSEQLLLKRAFGPEVTEQLLDSAGFWKQSKELSLSLLNVPRAIKSSIDISGLFRQALVLGARHPVIWSRSVPTYLKAFKSEEFYQGVMKEITELPTYPTMQKAGVRFTNMEESVFGREENFMSNLAEKIPVFGRAIRASGRSYVAFLNRFRAYAFDNYLEMAENPYRSVIGKKMPGRDLESPENAKALKDIAGWVNHATGQGTFGQLRDSLVILNATLFSPRLIKSRLQLMNPVYYARLDPFARKQALQGMAQLLGGITLTLQMAKMAGAEVVMDPRSSDFGKIKVGDTRVDIAGGFQQYIVWAARFYTSETMSSGSGEVTKLEGGYGKKSRATITWDMIENKLAPVPGLGVDWGKNQNFNYDEFNWKKDPARLFIPLNLENAYEGYTEGSPATGAASLLLGGVGFGTQTYKPNESKRKKRRPRSLWVP